MASELGAGAGAILSAELLSFRIVTAAIHNAGFVFTAASEIAARAEVIALIDDEIQKVNKTIGKVEQIAKFYVVPDVWTADGGELTQTQKLKRKAIAEKYKAIIDAIYLQDRASK